MSAPYRLTETAARQRDEIVAYLAERRPAATEAVYAAIEAACARLADRPDSGHTRADLTAEPLKFWTVCSSYRIIYDPAATPLEVVAIVHTSRDVAAVLHDR